MRKFLKSPFRALLFLLLIIALPVFVWAVLSQRFELRKRAASSEPSACSPLGNTITVSPQGSSGTCHDIQTAINTVSGPNFMIQLMPGTYNVPDLETPFSLTISNKTNLILSGASSAGVDAVQLNFPNNRGGILVENSNNVMIQWMKINGQTNNGLVSSRGSNSTSLGYLILNDQGAHTVDFSNGSGGSLYNSTVTSYAGAVDLNNMAGIYISNNIFRDARGGIAASNVTGSSSILGNLFINISGPALAINQTSNFNIEHNTITNIHTSELNNSASILVTNSIAQNTTLTFRKNIIANNQGIGIMYQNPANIFTIFEYNDVFNNSLANFSGITDYSGTNGNISADPLFGPDYCLMTGSPALLTATINNTNYMGYRGLCGPFPSTTPSPSTCSNQPNGSSCTNTECPTCTYSTPRCLVSCRNVPGTCQNNVCVSNLTPTPTSSQIHSIKVLYPNGGENLTNGSTVRIQYRASPEIANVLLSYQITNTSNYIYITHTPVPNTGYYDWNVDFDPSYYPLPYQTRIRVEAAPPLYQVYDVSDANFTIASAGQFNFDFRIKFAGVTDGMADKATATIRFVGTNGVNMITPPVIFHHIGGGIYQALVTIPNTFMIPGPGYQIIVKGEKHVARKFCQQVGQTGPCPPGTYINIPITTIPLLFDFTTLPLQPGDVPPQDGVADVSDLFATTSLLSKACSALTTQDKYMGDLNYDGCVDMKDIFLFRQTLQTRYDEN